MYLFSILTDNTIYIISEENTHTHHLLIYQMTPTLLFTDLPVGTFTINGLKKWIDQSVKYTINVVYNAALLKLK